MREVIADISNYQNSSNNHQWLSSLKNKYNAKSVCILTSQGDSWKQPYAGYQAYEAFKVFGNFSCYHFFLGSGKAEAMNFVQALKNIGADKSTVVMIDCETKVPNLTSHINAFIDYVWDAGYKNIFVYSMESYFGSNIIISQLHHKPKIWVANISYEPKMKYDAWQYTWTGKVLGTDVDLDIDTTGLLSRGIESKPKSTTPEFWKNGKVFIVKSDSIRVYQDETLNNKKETYNLYTKGTHFDVEKVIKYKNTYRLKTKYGYTTANKKYVEKYR